MADQSRNIPRPFPQVRHFNPYYIQSVIQIAAEFAVFNKILQIPIGCRNNPYICLYRHCAAYTEKFSVLNDSKQFRLHIGLQFSDFVKKDCAVVSQFKISLLPRRIRACKSAFFISEEFRFNQCRGNRSAVDLDKRLHFPVAVFMNDIGDLFFADTGIPRNQHIAVIFGNSQNLLQHCRHSVALAHKILQHSLSLSGNLHQSGLPVNRIRRIIIHTSVSGFRLFDIRYQILYNLDIKFVIGFQIAVGAAYIQLSGNRFGNIKGNIVIIDQIGKYNSASAFSS